MVSTTRLRVRRWFSVALLGVTLLMAPPVQGRPAAHASVTSGLPSSPRATRVQQGEAPFFPETGFRIGSRAFADYFTRRGGLRTFGYPVSNTFRLLGSE